MSFRYFGISFRDFVVSWFTNSRWLRLVAMVLAGVVVAGCGSLWVVLARSSF